MKKSVLILAAIGLLMTNCDNRTATQQAADDFNKEVRETEDNQMRHERYIDSLVNVATGLDGETLVRNRQNALDILRREYPEMSDKWDAVQESINNMELY